MEKISDIKLIVFDLYHTLIYPEYIAKPYTELLKTIGIKNSEELKIARKIAMTKDFNTIEEYVKIIAPQTKLKKAVYEKYDAQIQKEIRSTKVYPEVVHVLDKLVSKNIQIGLISNLASPYKIPFLKSELAEYFNKVILSCDIGITKPNLEIYQKMIESIAIKPSQALMIGDSIRNDVEGPKAIGMNAIHLDRIGNSENSIKSLDEIFKYI
ncbi:MAG: HAD family hydrolase [Candidatus Woesearchaeota archaeon]